ncbi:hypothetical protein [Halocatena halophila]|uniref:hypothetical protein n=1 Tax=Halocatena halophila TaxID=2814576 RepID=UPI002ED1A26D
MIRKRLSATVLLTILLISVVGIGLSSVAIAGDRYANQTLSNDDDSDRADATALGADGTATDALTANDTDWYEFDASSGERIRASLELGPNDSTIHPGTDARIDLFNSAGEKINVYPNDGMGSDYRPSPGSSSVAYGGAMATESATYFVRVSGTNVSDYDISVSTDRLDQYDPNEQPSSATHVAAGETVSATMSGQDVDTYAIQLDKGETIAASAETDSTGLVNIQLTGPDTPDTTFAGYHGEHDVSNESPQTKTFTHTAAQSGTYYVRVYPTENGIGSFWKSAAYSLSVTVNANETPTDTPQTETDTEDTTQTPTEADDTATPDDRTETRTPETTPADDDSVDTGDTDAETTVADSTDADTPDSDSTDSPPC